MGKNCRLLAISRLVPGLFVLGQFLGFEASAADRLPLDLLVELQPLRPRTVRTEEIAPKLRPAAALHGKQKWQQACDSAEALRSALMRTAAKLFYAPDRKKGGDVDGIERFLDAYVRGKMPLLELPLDVFSPAAGFRAIAVDACIRADRGDLALPFLAEIAGAARPGSADGTAARLALAVALAQRTGRWSAGVAVLTPEDAGVRVLLLRALAETDAAKRTVWLAEARKSVARPEDPALMTRVEALLTRTP